MRNESTTMMICDLPNDLEWEILARVPAKSLQALKTTCKQWYSLIKDPKFVEKNRKMSSEAARESMVLSNHELYSIAGDLHNSGDIAQPLEFTGKLPKDMFMISHCDGLMLCQAKYNSSVVVWNPCTGQTKMIEPRTRYRNTDRFAIGYSSSSSSRSYKILRCGYYPNEEKVLAVEWEMYDLYSDSWRILHSCTLDYQMFCLDYQMFCSGVSLRGDTYFVAVGYQDSGFFLMKFDFTAERFVRLPLPFQSLDAWDTAVLSVVRDEKLSVCRQEILGRSNVMRIWVTNKVDEEGKELSWRKDIVLQVNFNKFELSYTAIVTSFLLDEEKKVAVCCEFSEEEEEDSSSRPNGKTRTNIYIVGEDMYKSVYNPTAKGYCPLVLTYVPSLVHIQ